MATKKQKAKDLQKELKARIKETNSQLHHSAKAQDAAKPGTSLIIFENQHEIMLNDKTIMQSLDLLLGDV